MTLTALSPHAFLRRWTRTLTAPLAALAALALAVAPSRLPAHTSATGEISGRVQNEATGQYLNNARVTVKGTDLTAFTDETGGFVLPRVPAGAVTLEVLYSGLDPLQVPLTVAAGQRNERDINLNSRDRYGAASASGTVKLDAFVLSASKLTEGEALATNEQRFAKNIKNVVATDAFGDVTEGNVAEFMKFMPGVTIEYSDASPNAVAVRGFDSNMTAVTADGAQLANASGSAANRAFLFTQVSINNVSRIEVTKVPTPANPADGISGTVNMISKSSFERSRMAFNYRAFLNASSDGMMIKDQPFPFDTLEPRVNPGFDFDLTLPITKNFGIVFTGLHSKQWNEQNISTMTWNATAAGTGATPAKPFLQSHAIVDAPKWYTRDSTSLKADWRITRNSVLSFGSQASYYRDKNGNITRTTTAGTNATPSVAGGTPLSYDGTRTIGATGRGGVTFSGNFLHIDARTIAANTRYRYDDGTWLLDSAASISNSKTWRRYEQKGSFQSLTTALVNPVRVSFEGITDVRPTTTRAFDNTGREVDLYDINNYRLNTAAQTDYRDHKEDVFGYNLDLKRAFNVFDIPTNLQIGGRYRAQDRDRRSYNRTFTYTPPSGNLSPAPFVGQVYKNRPNYFGFDNIPWLSNNRAVEAWRQDPRIFTQTAAQLVAEEQSRIVGSEQILETVTGLYAQTELRFFRNRISFLTGVRYEKTHDKGVGPLYEPANVWQRTTSGAFLRNAAGQRIRKPEAGAAGSMEELRLVRLERANHANRAYDGYYPSAHVNFNVTEKFLLRAAYAKTYGRPDFANIVPNATITENDIPENNSDPSAIPGNINIRNTGLKPWTAQNYDLSAEYYTENGGLITGGVFRKDITNFFGNLQRIATPELLDELDLDQRYVGWFLDTTINSGDARVSGVELNVRQSLTQFGKWGRYFSVFANATKLKLEGSRSAAFTRFVPTSANWGVTFTKRPLTVMLNWHHRGEQDRGASTGQGPLAKVYQDARTTMDVNLSYQLSRRLTLFASGRNVTNVWFNNSRYQADTPVYARRSSTNSYGAQWAFGVKGTF
ncbi:MAG: TonB-dependent receptor [Verrucomicrobia bacterium]|nr:TonB-dependent receptor [Verrucomicrobiota bacterium]